MNPTIAVVIPAFNSESTIRSAINSVLAQTSPPDEIIVVDDGSTDGTAEVVRNFGTRVKLITQPNQGSAVARQSGSDAATSEYIAYLDADDWWPVDKLAVCRTIITQEHIDFLLADLQRARPDDPPEAYLDRNSTFFPRMWNYLRNYNVGSQIPDLYRLPPETGLALLLDGFPVFPSTMLIRRNVLEAVGGWDARFRRCQDFDVGLRIARQYPLHYLHRVQAILGLHDLNSDLYAYIAKQSDGDLRVLHAHFDAATHDSVYRQQIARTLARKLYSLGNTHKKAGKKKLARHAYFQAMHWPGKRLYSLTRWIWTYL